MVLPETPEAAATNPLAFEKYLLENFPDIPPEVLKRLGSKRFDPITWARRKGEPWSWEGVGNVLANWIPAFR